MSRRCLAKTSWRHLGRRKIVTLKTSSRSLENVSWRCLEGISWRRLEDMSSRRSGDMSWRHFKTSWGQKEWRISESHNLNVYLSNKSISDKSIYSKSNANPKSLIRTQSFQYWSYFEIQTVFLFWELKSWWLFGVVKSAELKFDIAEQVRQ